MARYFLFDLARGRSRWLVGALSSLAAIAMVAPPAWAGVAAAETPSGITVIGQGIVRADPDTAVITVGAAATAATVEEATARVGGEVDAFVTALRWQGVASADIKTIALNIYPQYGPRPPFAVAVPAATPAPVPPPSAPSALPPKAIFSAEQAGPVASPPPPPAFALPAPTLSPFPPPPVIVGYRVEQILDVRTHDIDAAGPIIETAVRVLGRDILLQGTRFTIENTDPLLEQARAQAFANARAAAEQLAQLAGVRLGPPLSITEASSGRPTPVPAAAPVGLGGGIGPVPAGQNEVSIIVQVTFAILP